MYFGCILKTKHYTYNMKYNSILWCILDYSSIKYYDSKDTPINLIEYKKIKNE